MSEIDSGGIFVSYRRQDTCHVAGRLFDRLAERFGRSHVFMDVVSIEPGFDFAEAINDGVSGCDVLLVLIGQSWLSAVDEQGRRRLDNPDDLVLLEVKAALDQHVRVIPVLIDGTSAPRRDELPKVIADLTRRNWVRLNHETFGSDVAVLMDVLDRIMRPDSGRNAAVPNVVVGQGNLGPGGPTADSQRASPGVGDLGAQGQALSMLAAEAVTTATGSTDPTWAVRASTPGATSTGPTRTMEAAGAINKRAAQAVLAITLAVLAVPVVAGLIIDSKQFGDTLGILWLLLFFLMIVGVVAIWMLRQLPREEKNSLKRFWVTGPTLALLLVVIPGTIVVPRLMGFWNNISSGHAADGASPTMLSPGIATADSTSKVACGNGHICIYPEANYGGVPYVLRATDDSTSLVDTPINDKTFSVINNGGSPRTARIYRSESYSGSHTCIQPGGRIADLRGFAVSQWGSSLKLNDDRCG